MNSLDADGNGEGDLERGWSLPEFMSGRRCKIHRCTSNLIPVFRLIQPVASRTTKRGGRKLTKMYEDANLTTSSNVYIRPCCILTSWIIGRYLTTRFPRNARASSFESKILFEAKGKYIMNANFRKRLEKHWNYVITIQCDLESVRIS